MTIHNFFINMFCVLWVYVLAMLYGKLCIDRIRRMGRKRSLRVIDRYFSMSCSPKKRERLHSQMLGYAKDTLLLHHICDCYTNLPDSCPEDVRRELRDTMTKVLHVRIHYLHKDDVVNRYLLIHSLYQCGIYTPEIQHFLWECGAPRPKGAKSAAEHEAELILQTAG